MAIIPISVSKSTPSMFSFACNSTSFSHHILIHFVVANQQSDRFPIRKPRKADKSHQFSWGSPLCSCNNACTPHMIHYRWPCSLSLLSAFQRHFDCSVWCSMAKLMIYWSFCLSAYCARHLCSHPLHPCSPPVLPGGIFVHCLFIAWLHLHQLPGWARRGTWWEDTSLQAKRNNHPGVGIHWFLFNMTFLVFNHAGSYITITSVLSSTGLLSNSRFEAHIEKVRDAMSVNLYWSTDHIGTHLKARVWGFVISRIRHYRNGRAVANSHRNWSGLHLFGEPYQLVLPINEYPEINRDLLSCSAWDFYIDTADIRVEFHLDSGESDLSTAADPVHEKESRSGRISQWSSVFFMDKSNRQ